MFTTLHAQLTAAGIPIVGVAGKLSDRSTWRIDFAPEATDEQKAQAAQIVAAFDVEKADHNVGIDAQIAALEATVTPRRMREAIRGYGKAWLDAVDTQIVNLRAQRV